MNIDEMYMRRCLQLALNGLGHVSTNPLVGAVIVYNGTIIGEGYHRRFGEAHAEVNAVACVQDKELLKNSTLYVNLEPCSHYGKTPPCCDLIIHHQFKKVVIGTIDTFSQVAGRGLQKLKEAGIETITGIMETECRELNKRFFCFHEKQRPYIILKRAETANGYMAQLPEEYKKEGAQISNDYSNRLVHKWRAEEDAILVGKNTALLDNPQLTARLWEGKNPVRVIIDRNLEVPQNQAVYDSQAKTIVINNSREEVKGNIVFAKIAFDKDFLSNLLKRLHAENIQSVLVEGGPATLNQFINEGLWDEGRIIRSGRYWEHGIQAPKIGGKLISKENLHGDEISILTSV